jgi:hypothetical protein
VVYLAEIGTMPIWRDIGNLGQWEDRVKSYLAHRETGAEMREPMFLLAEEIFELGCYNLYGGIQLYKTQAEFERVRGLLLKAGVANVPATSTFDFSDW